MLLAEAEAIPAWMVGLGVLIGGPVSLAVGAAVTWLVKERRNAKRDTITDLYAIIDRQQKQLDGQTIDIKSLTERASKAEVGEARCRGEVARLESEIKGLSKDLRRLMESANDLPPGVTRPCVIIASVPDGIIRNVSTEAGALFHWAPDELVGRSVTDLMPSDIKPIHKRKMEMMVADGRHADPANPVRTYGITSDGKRFPIVINLSGPWSTKDGTKHVNAEIRRRGDSDSFVVPHGPKTPPEGVKLEETVKAPEKEGG